MNKGVKKSLVSAVVIGTLIIGTMGIGIANAKTEHPHSDDTWKYYSSFNVTRWQKSCHSNYKSGEDHTSTAQVGNNPKDKKSATPRYYSNALAYGDKGTGKAWYNNTSDVGSVFGF